MKRILLLALMLSLTACHSSSESESSTIVFNPNSGDVSFPNDFWFIDSDDGTLNISVNDESDALDYIIALNASDGWSTNAPFEIAIDFFSDVELNSTSIDGNSVLLYQVVMGEDCLDPDIGEFEVCSVSSSLTYGTDYSAKATSAGIEIQTLSPLLAKTSYMLVLTDELKDSNGNAIVASSSYQSLAQAPEVGSASEMQGMINSYEDVAAGQGVNQDSIIYTMTMTTQSVDDVLLKVKDLVVDAGATTITVNDTGYDLATFLSANGYILTDTQSALFSTGNYYTGSLSLPYYSGIATADNIYAPLTEHWSATTEIGSEYNLTKDNTTPKENTACDDQCISDPGEITVQMTVPNDNSGLTMPDTGWPVVILQHGVTSQKSDMLAVTGVLSAYGFATIAIDLPLHGDRGFDLDNDGIDDINASTNAYSDYVNLAHLLVTRSNMRQGIADLLGLRYALQNISGATIDSNDVQFMGHSLGAITGISFSALANTTTGDTETDAEFAIDSLSLASPGVGIADFLMESGYFGGLIESGLAYTYDSDFQNYFLANGYISTDDLERIYTAYYNSLDEAEQLALNNMLNKVLLAAQTTIDSADPVNYTASLAELDTPIHLMEVVGNDTENYSDQVIPNEVLRNSNAGTEAAIKQLGLTGTDTSDFGTNFAVRFAYGYHSSILSSSACPYYTTTDEAKAKCEAATGEMQSQMVSFLYARGQYLNISDESVIETVE